MITFYEYSKCTTCRKGKSFLKDNNLNFTAHDMVKDPPAKHVLKEIVGQSDYSTDDFFNKRGKKFKDLDLKNKLDEMTDEEKLNLLSSDGLLIKRPLLVTDENVLLGFKESEYETVLL